MNIETYNKLENKLKIEVEKGNVEAMVDLANLYYQGPNMDEENLKKALPYFIKAADCGNTYAMSKAGLALICGINGVEKDTEKALIYLDKVANAGITEIQNYLGSLYQYGNFVEQDYDKALHYYKMSALDGDATGQFGLSAVKVFLGHDDWFRWLCIAHVNGSEEATDHINHIIETGGKSAYEDVQNEIRKIKESLKTTYVVGKDKK